MKDLQQDWIDRNKPLRAEDVAKEYTPCWQPTVKDCQCPMHVIRLSIAKALTEFAEARVKEALKYRDLTVFGEYWEKDGKRVDPLEVYKNPSDYRNEALEEAAKVALGHCCTVVCECPLVISEDIRALKNEGPGAEGDTLKKETL